MSTEPSITCDPEKLKEVIKSLLIHAINNNVYSNIVSIFLDDDVLDFNVNIWEGTKELTEEIRSIEAVRLTIKNQGDKLTEQQLQLIPTPTFKQTNELTFFECFNVINAHYGNFKIGNNQDKGINYNFTIPVNIQEIRPKINGLPDIRIDNLKKIAEIFLQAQKDDRLNIAQKLFQACVDFDIIERITLIKKEEFTNIKN